VAIGVLSLDAFTLGQSMLEKGKTTRKEKEEVREVRE
jgi:hypothetical protein